MSDLWTVLCFRTGLMNCLEFLPCSHVSELNRVIVGDPACVIRPLLAVFIARVAERIEEGISVQCFTEFRPRERQKSSSELS
jgi:hypothetical protein